MLTVNQILDLIKHGFTDEQIEYLNGLSQPGTGGTPTHENPKPPADQGIEPEALPPSTPPATSATPPEDPSSGDAIKALTSQIAALSETVKQMQTVNAHRAEQQPAQKVTADSIIKDFFGISVRHKCIFFSRLF